jgi:hypothetical protein
MFELDKLELFPKSSRTVRFVNCSTHLYWLTAGAKRKEGRKGRRRQLASLLSVCLPGYPLCRKNRVAKW